MALTNLSLTNFKNYTYDSFQFDHRIICIAGPNGVGKTNILDAIYLLCIGKSYFLTSEKKMIRWGSDFFRVQGDFDAGKVVIKQRISQPKIIEFNDKKYERLADHIGKNLVIIISPDDIELINGQSIFRRKWMDIALCQVNKRYLQCLANYNRLLKQRNAYLKMRHGARSNDMHLLDTYDEKMTPWAKEIYKIRRQFLSAIEIQIELINNQVSLQNDSLTIEYKSDLVDRSFEKILLDNHQKDLMLQRTSEGPHRDDFSINLNGNSAKQFGSQGQKKTILFALQIAFSNWLMAEHGKSAYLLLDDIFDKLDPNRAQALISSVSAGSFEQIFITDAHPHRLNQLLESLGIEFGYVHLTKDIKDEEAE